MNLQWFLTSIWIVLVRVARHEVLKKRPDSGIKIEYVIQNEVSPREYRLRAPSRGTTQITELQYADDEVIFAISVEELKTILEIYDRTFTRFGLKMSYSKTETMAFNVNDAIKNREGLINIGNNKIKNVRTFKYLGYMITNDEEKTSRFLACKDWDCLPDVERT